MTDDLVDRINYQPLGIRLAPVPWPAGLAPTALLPRGNGPAPLPKADVLVVTWTSAEWMALGDVLSPLYKKERWPKYTKDFAAYEPHLTGRSPAREAKCLGEYMLTVIGNTRVLLFHSQLHLATDDATAPIVALWQQIVGEVQPKLVITTGTAGGIGADTQLGDVFVCTDAKFNCTQTFKSKSWAQERYSSTSITPGTHTAMFPQLSAVNADLLRPIAKRPPVLTFGGDVETVDYFAFADTDDSYGVVANDPQAHSEEMDDCTLPLALSTLKDPPPWISVRNASDPQVPSSIGDLAAQKKFAASIYERFGYWTTVGSAIACWALIADL